MRNIPNNFKRFYYWMIDLIAPPSCTICGQVETWLCEDCAPQIRLLTGVICQRCGKLWDQSDICPACHHTPLKVAPVRSAFRYDDTIRHIIHALKYRGATELVTTLSPQLHNSWQQYNLPSDMLVPVPLHPTRERKRGYNQSHIIAQTLSTLCHIPIHSALMRIRNTASQTQLNKQQRQKNVNAAFAHVPDITVAHKHITLVDDVATTGATLDACATVLLNNGAKSVNAFTLARAT